MHRSGTSVLAGVLDRLGLDPGNRALMLQGDEFNSDGYWERRDIVEWHDRALRRVNAWASAPPDVAFGHDDRLLPRVADIPAFLGTYTRSWMIKDPRQCLFLPLWHLARDQRDLHVIAVRDPVEVGRSLGRRNGYSADLSNALWERYMFDALRGSRSCATLVIDYRSLTDDPASTIGLIVEALDHHQLGTSTRDDAAIAAAIELVRPARVQSFGVASAGASALYHRLLDLRGYHQSLTLDRIELSGESRRVIARRRHWLNALGIAGSTSAAFKARLDRKHR